jgi:hypothetical protein
VAGVITGHPVTVLRYETDRLGDRVKVAEFIVFDCAYAPRTTSSSRGTVELTDRTGAVSADAELYTPYGADITPQDVIRLADGTEWEVVGAPERWESPFPGAWAAGTVVPLRRKTG